MIRTRLILVPAQSDDPAPFLIVSPNGTVLERGSLTLDAPDLPERLPTVAVVPGTEVSVAWLDLPKGRPAQVRATALWGLRDRLASEADRLAVAVGTASGQDPRPVAVVGQALLSAWLGYLEALGVRPDAVVPDVMTLDAPFDDDVVSAVSFGPATALRGRTFAATVQPDLVEVIADGRRIEPVERAETVEAMLARAALAPALNLLEGMERTEEARPGRWRLAAGLAAALVLSPLVLVLAGATRDQMAADRMRQQAVAEITARQPEAAQSPDPVAEVRRRAEVAPPPGGVAGAAAGLFHAVEAVPGAELDMLTSDPEGGLRATVSYGAYADLAALKRAMSDRGLSLKDLSTLDDNGRVVSDILIGAAL